MQYISVEDLKIQKDSIAALIYIRKLWYQLEEGYFFYPIDYPSYKNQLDKLQLGSPIGWSLQWKPSSFIISKRMENQGLFSITIQKNGSILYRVEV